MNFKTEVPIENQFPSITHQSKIALFGSCFVENIGDKLKYFKFDTYQNPFGIIFNPIAIQNLFEKMNSGYQYSAADIFYLNEQYACYDVHSSLNKTEEQEYLEHLNILLSDVSNYLKTATHLVLTLGTAWVYENKENQKVVANCHKVPQRNFNKRLLTTHEISNSLQKISAILWNWNPSCKVIITVSPVRHLKDGFIENQQSKAQLVVGFNKFLKELTAEECNQIAYFPSYEIMMDELRDYRFYADDMVHPSGMAINYIWEKFKGAWVNNKTTNLLTEIDAIQKGLNHRPFNENSQSHQKFLKKLHQKIIKLTDRESSINF
ncbi:GSCFA domain-containing protein [Zunongwangia sp.]|uniref:GSCFA domain-containing protein n=1 Tax=Zunongwangia sp. TaxID=1965325 RepID=UPI003AA8B302